jgi:signal transduction histidine kinase
VKRRDARLALVAAALIGLALLAVFAIELSNTQAKSKKDIEARVHERAVLAGALIDGLFQTVTQNLSLDTKTYGGASVTTATMNLHVGNNKFVALLNSSGGVIAASSSFNAQARADLSHSQAVALVRAGHPYGLGNLEPYGHTGALDFAVQFPTPYGKRVLLSGTAPLAIGTFLKSDLLKIPGVKGAHNYVLDGNDAVLASNNPAYPTGSRLSKPGQEQALRVSSGDRNGHYFDQVQLLNSTWRILLAAPNGPLFASIGGLHKWIPWIIFAAFALVGLLALLLGRSVLDSADKLRGANVRLELLNGELGQTNATLERRAAELVRSNGELEQFASIASHDLQEPLRKVRTFTQQLTVIDADNLSEKGRDYLERANAAAERMQNLIEDLLRFSRVATHGRPFAPVDLGTVTHEVLDDLESQVERSGAIVDVGKLPTISADALQMRQLMQNLISNAIKFRRPGVTPEVTIRAHVDGERMKLTVADNGIGFEPQYNRRIFRVFERLHGRSEYPGTGIGLALCRKIAERHGGSAAADSEPGKGSVFTITMPLHQTEEVLLPLAPLDHDDTATEAAEEEAHAAV